MEPTGTRLNISFVGKDTVVTVLCTRYTLGDGVLIVRDGQVISFKERTRHVSWVDERVYVLTHIEYFDVEDVYDEWRKQDS